MAGQSRLLPPPSTEKIPEPPQTESSTSQTVATSSPSVNREPIEDSQFEDLQLEDLQLEDLQLEDLQLDNLQALYDLFENDTTCLDQVDSEDPQTTYASGSALVNQEPIEDSQHEGLQLEDLQPEDLQALYDLFENGTTCLGQVDSADPQTAYCTGSPSVNREPIEDPQLEALQAFYNVLENVGRKYSFQADLSAHQTIYGSPLEFEDLQAEIQQAFDDALEYVESQNSLQGDGIISQVSIVGNEPNKIIETKADCHQSSKHEEPIASTSEETREVQVSKSGVAKCDSDKGKQRLIDKENICKNTRAAKNRGLIYVITHINDYIYDLSKKGNLHSPPSPMVSVPLIFELHGLELYPGAETVIGFAENSAELGNEGESVEEIEREFIEKALREKDNDDLTKNTNTDYSIAFPARELAVKQPTNKNNMILTNDQIKIHNWLVSLNENDLNSILMGGMRNENIIQAIALVIYHIEKQKTKEPILIIVPARFRSSFVWKEEFTKWAPWLAVDYIYKNPLNLRYENAPTFDVLITTIKYYFEVQEIYEKINWSYLILDVGETVMSSHVQVMEAINARYSASRRLVFVEKLENRLSPLWALVNFIVPSIFKSTSKFEEWFNKPFDKTDLKVALNEEETTLVISHLQKVLRPLIQRRLVAEVKDNVAVPVVEPIKRRKRLRLSQIRGNI